MGGCSKWEFSSSLELHRQSVIKTLKISMWPWLTHHLGRLIGGASISLTVFTSVGRGWCRGGWRSNVWDKRRPMKSFDIFGGVSLSLWWCHEKESHGWLIMDDNISGIAAPITLSVLHIYYLPTHSKRKWLSTTWTFINWVMREYASFSKS